VKTGFAGPLQKEDCSILDLSTVFVMMPLPSLGRVFGILRFL
jgi:hypothetical protein